MNRLVSTGVYFTEPAPAKDLPLLPGRIIRVVEAETPMMVGEFRGEDGNKYAMLVNLSLERSARFRIILQQEHAGIRMISSASGNEKPYDPEEGYWLVAGQGILLKL
jgi:hypothetical protein